MKLRIVKKSDNWFVIEIYQRIWFGIFGKKIWRTAVGYDFNRTDSSFKMKFSSLEFKTEADANFVLNFLNNNNFLDKDCLEKIY